MRCQYSREPIPCPGHGNFWIGACLNHILLSCITYVDFVLPTNYSSLLDIIDSFWKRSRSLSKAMAKDSFSMVATGFGKRVNHSYPSNRLLLHIL